jgi:hypothetical protein
MRDQKTRRNTHIHTRERERERERIATGKCVYAYLKTHGLTFSIRDRRGSRSRAFLFLVVVVVFFGRLLLATTRRNTNRTGFGLFATATSNSLAELTQCIQCLHKVTRAYTQNVNHIE